MMQTLTLQFAPGASVAGQVEFDSEKSGLLGPTMSDPVKVTGAGPELVMVSVSHRCCPFVTVPKFTDVGVNPMEIPVPLRAAVCGLVVSLSATLTVPAW